MKKLLSAILFNILALCVSAHTYAAITVVFEETGGDVVATATGSLDTSGMSVISSSGATGILFYGAPDQWIYEVGSGPGDTYNVAFSPAQPLHSSAFPATPADTDSGVPVGVLNSISTGPRILVPSSYSSGSSISATATWTGATFASLNLAVGTYVFDYGQDSLTYIVQGAPVPPSSLQAVPALPLSWLLVIIAGLVGAGTWRLKGKRGSR